MKLRAQGPARGGGKILHTKRGQGHSFVALHTKLHRNDVIAIILGSFDSRDERTKLRRAGMGKRKSKTYVGII